MAQLDRFIKVMLDTPASEFVLASNAAPRIVLNGQGKDLIARTIVTSQVRFLLKELAPAAVLTVLESKGAADFNYKPEGLDPVQVTILAWAGETNAVFRRPNAASYGSPPSARGRAPGPAEAVLKPAAAPAP